MDVFITVIGWILVAMGVFQLLLLFIFAATADKQGNTDPEKRPVMGLKGLLYIIVLPSTALCLGLGLWLALFR
jgi:uncharacterized membrane protein